METIPLTLSCRAGPAGPEGLGATHTQEALAPLQQQPPIPTTSYSSAVAIVAIADRLLAKAACLPNFTSSRTAAEHKMNDSQNFQPNLSTKLH